MKRLAFALLGIGILGSPTFAQVQGLPPGASQSIIQTNGTQKTQIVDGSGSVIASTSNNLNVQCANCSGSGVSTADEATFTAGTSLFVGAGGFYQTTATSNALTNGKQGMAQMTANRALFANLRDSSGNEEGLSGQPLQVSLANTAANSTAVTVGQATGTNLHVVCDSGCSSSTAPADEATFTAGSTSQSPVGGFYQTTATSNALTTGKMGAFQVTAQRAIFANLRDSSGNEIGLSGQPLQVTVANTGANTTGIVVGNTQGSTTSGQSGPLDQGAVTTSAPSYSNGQTSPLNMTTAGALRIDHTSVAGTAQLVNTGATGAGSPRMTVAVDSATVAGSASLPTGTNSIGGVAISPTVTNPTSSLTMTSATTAYTAGQLIANNATAGSITVPSFAISTSAGAAAIPRLRLTSNDATTTAWPVKTIQVDLWSAAPTFTNGDRGTFAVATGSAGHLGSYQCVTSAENGDGVYSECYPLVGNFALVKLASGTSVFWTLEAITASGVTGATKVFTLTAELMN